MAGLRRNWCSHFGKLSTYLLKLRINLPYESVDPFLVVNPKETHAHLHQVTGKRIFKASLFVMAPKLETTQVPINSRMDKYIVVYSCNR